MSNIEESEKIVKYTDFTKFAENACKKVDYLKNRVNENIKDKATLRAKNTILNEEKHLLEKKLNETELKLKSYQKCDIQNEENAFGFTNNDFDEMLRLENEMEEEIYNNILNELKSK
jgi:hypothetical protein